MSRRGEYWTVERDFGGLMPQSLNGMRESAGRVLATPVVTSRSEAGMARAILYLLDEIERLRPSSP